MATDLFELSQYAEIDHDIIQFVQNMNEQESFVIQLTDYDHVPMTETDGTTPVEVSFGREDMLRFLKILKNSGRTFEEMIVDCLHHAIEFENGS